MVKSKGRKSKPSKQRVKLGRNMALMGLDAGAIAHIKLMADPCQGRLVPAAYPSPGGGAVVRLRQVITVGTNTGETAGIFHWVPGYNEYIANGGATPGSSFTPVPISAIPGLSTLSGSGNSAVSFRCIAACARLGTNASEMNRSGFVYAGQTNADYYGPNAGSTTNVSLSIGGLPVMARMPAKHLEVLWAPMNGDQDYFVDGNTSGFNIGQGNSNAAITIGFTGSPAGVGVQIELIGVYEVNYNSTSGFVTSMPSPVTTSPWSKVLNTFYQVINNAPVIVDTMRSGMEYMNTVMNSVPGRAVAGAARLALTL